MAGEVRQREPRLEVPALRETAEGKPCLIRSRVCNGRTDTTVWCHSNQDRHGKGKGLKSHDPFGAFGCSACHDFIDNRIPHVAKEEQVGAFEAGRDRTLLYLFRHGHLKVDKKGKPL